MRNICMVSYMNHHRSHTRSVNKHKRVPNEARTHYTATPETRSYQPRGPISPLVAEVQAHLACSRLLD